MLSKYGGRYALKALHFHQYIITIMLLFVSYHSWGGLKWYAWLC